MHTYCIVGELYRISEKINIIDNQNIILMSESVNILKSVFAESKQELLYNLEGLSLPKDSSKIEKIVTDYLRGLFENEGGFRQSLTEAEDYVLQSVLRLLQSQQDIAKEIAKSINESNSQDSKTAGVKEYPNSLMPYATVAGAGVGAVAGGLISTWAAVAGAIAGTAIVVYIASRPFSNKTSTKKVSLGTTSTALDSNVFLSIVEKICDNIDNVIETYRVQIKRVENIYEQRQAPTLTNNYAALLEQIENVYKFSSVEGVPLALKNAIDMLVETLENYNLKIENGKIISE